MIIRIMSSYLTTLAAVKGKDGSRRWLFVCANWAAVADPCLCEESIQVGSLNLSCWVSRYTKRNCGWPFEVA